MNKELIISIGVFVFFMLLASKTLLRKNIKDPKDRLDIDEYNYEKDKNMSYRDRFRLKIKNRRKKKDNEDKVSRIQDLINRSDVDIEIEEFIIFRLILISIMILISSGIISFLSLTSRSLLISFILLLLGLNIPTAFLKRRVKNRNKMFSDQLGDAISIFSNSIKAGYSFLQAVASVSREMPYPVSREFSVLLKEISLGMDTELALKNMTKRINSEDLELMITAILIQRETGGNLSEILDNISGTIRDRITIKGEVKTLTAQGKMSGLIVALLPIFLGILLFLINRELMMVLFTTTPGRISLTIAFVNELIGAFIISRIVKIEY